jgi:hypothetical protein
MFVLKAMQLCRLIYALLISPAVTTLYVSWLALMLHYTALMDRPLLISFSIFLHFTWLWRLMHYRSGFTLKEQMICKWGTRDCKASVWAPLIIIIIIIINSFQQSRWETSSFSAGQEIPGVLRNPLFITVFTTFLPFVPILSDINPLKTKRICFI